MSDIPAAKAAEPRIDADGQLTLLGIAPECHDCGTEADITSYRTRLVLHQGRKVMVRVGFRCSCGAVTSANGSVLGIAGK